MAASAKFWDRIANRYAKSPIADETAYQHKLKVTRQYFRDDMEVMELGCGTGSTAILHAPYVKHIQAVDISSKMLAIAQSKADQQQIENIDFQQAAIDDFEAMSESVDAVLALSILHLLDDKEVAIDKVYQMLRPGGVFVTSTVCLGDWLRFFRFIAPVGHFLGLIPLVKVFKAEELIESIKQAGFEIDYQWQPAKNKALFVVAKKPVASQEARIKGDASAF